MRDFRLCLAEGTRPFCRFAQDLAPAFFRPEAADPFVCTLHLFSPTGGLRTGRLKQGICLGSVKFYLQALCGAFASCVRLCFDLPSVPYFADIINREIAVIFVEILSGFGGRLKLELFFLICECVPSLLSRSHASPPFS